MIIPILHGIQIPHPFTNSCYRLATKRRHVGVGVVPPIHASLRSKRWRPFAAYLDISPALVLSLFLSLSLPVLRLVVGMEWVRGAPIGSGSFGTVNLAKLVGHSHHDGDDDNKQELPPTPPRLMAVKSVPLPHSSFLQRERRILADLQDCPHIVRCFGNDGDVVAADTGLLCNLFLEYVPGGTLAELVARSPGSRLPEPAVRRYTRSLLHGLQHVHAKGYVHCDVKPHNVLVGDHSDIKIADFGLAKKAGEDGGGGYCLRGTPLYMAPESVACGEYEAPADIWSLGCVVAEMASGRPAWGGVVGDDGLPALLMRIGYGGGEELPEIPAVLSEDGKDFLRRCFARDPAERWTAAMLLEHAFITTATEGDEEEEKECVTPADFVTDFIMIRASPRSILDYSSESDGPVERIARLAGGAVKPPSWFGVDDGDWITVRDGGFKI